MSTRRMLMSDKWQVGVLGLGHAGLPTAVGLAELGWPVIGVDSDLGKVEAINQGRAPFFEPELTELLRKHVATGRFRATAKVSDAMDHANILFVCVGTPHQANGSADMSQVEEAARQIAGSLNGAYTLIVEKSTAPVPTSRWIDRVIRRRNGHHDFEVACNPEFLREGTAVRDFLHPDRVVIGAESERARSCLKELYRNLNCPILITDLNTAEMIKVSANAFLAMKISFANMVADLCEAAEADIKDVAAGLGLDPRIGPDFLQAGIGYGGFCLPKDVRGFIHVAEQHGVSFNLLKEVERINESRIERFVQKVQQALWVLRDKPIAVWGLAFKPHTDDVRLAPSLKIVRRLLEEGSD